MEDAGLAQRDIDVGVVGNAGTRGYGLMPAQPVNDYIGMASKGFIRVWRWHPPGVVALTVG